MVVIYDTECYPNYWLLRMKGAVNRSFRAPLSPEDKREIYRIFNEYPTVSFNGDYYDIPMINAALNGWNLKQLNDDIIVGKKKPWELGLPSWEPADHVDIMQVAPGTSSLKQYGARIHAKKIQDLPYDPDIPITAPQMLEIDAYCDNDLDLTYELWIALQPHIAQREALGEKYGLRLVSKSDAQVAENILRKQCGNPAKLDIDWNLAFRYETPPFITFELPQLRNALSLVQQSVFTLSAKGSVQMPPLLEGLTLAIGGSVYRMGIGGLHSSEKCTAHTSGKLYDNDVARYYPQLILNSGKFPLALGPVFQQEFQVIADARLEAKRLRKVLPKDTPEYIKAVNGDEGGKIMINGTFGKTGSPYSILFAPSMLIQTTITGQLCLLMLIEWHERYGIPVVSANTDGIVIDCPDHLLATSRYLIGEWEKRTGLQMETVQYRAIYSRDVNNYFAVKTDGSVKRKGEYAVSGLNEKKNPDVEICSDAVSDFLSQGIPIEYSVASCTDIRKFITVTKVTGGGTKMWGVGPKPGALVRDMLSTLEAHGWVKSGRKWLKEGHLVDARQAYEWCFEPQVPEYLGKVVRWYYSTNAPGWIESSRGIVSLSEGSRPCMELPDTFPTDVDYEWYIDKCNNILKDIGYAKD